MERIAGIIAQDPGHRGIAALRVPGALAAATHVLAQARRVLIITGFPVGPDGVAETDGPPGALFLGRALSRRGAEVTFATQRRCAAALSAGLEALGLPLRLETLSPGEEPESLIDRLAPDAVVAIELPGRAADGQYYNMRGMRITDCVDPLDGLLLTARERGIPTVAIGDGGNEAGMGNVTERVHRAVPHGPRIASVVPCDHLIVAGTSNWGAYGLIAALDRGLLHQPEEEMALLERLVEAGAVDGCLLEPATTVDGIDQASYLSVVAQLHRWER